MSKGRKDRTSASVTQHENAKAPRRMMIFVITIFLLACLAALAFTLTSHPGAPNGVSLTPAAEQAR